MRAGHHLCGGQQRHGAHWHVCRGVPRHPGRGGVAGRPHPRLRQQAGALPAPPRHRRKDWSCLAKSTAQRCTCEEDMPEGTPSRARRDGRPDRMGLASVVIPSIGQARRHSDQALASRSILITRAILRAAQLSELLRCDAGFASAARGIGSAEECSHNMGTHVCIALSSTSGPMWGHLSSRGHCLVHNESYP